jgi:PAS domain S-box-containing protein
MRWDRYPNFEFVPGALLLVDPQGRIAEINNQAAAPLGYSRDELVGQPAESLIAAPHREKYLRFLANTLSMQRAGPVVSSADLLTRRKDGSEIPTRILFTLAVIENGCHPLNLFAGPDDPLCTNDTLLRTLARFTGLGCASCDGFVLLREDGRIEDCNQEFCGILGYDHEDLLQLNISDLETAEVSGETTRFLQQIPPNGWDRLCTRYRRKTSKAVPLEIVIGHFPLENGRRFVGFVHHDLSGHRSVLLATALEAVPNPVMITDCEGRILWANAAFDRMTGFVPEEYLERTPRLLASGSHPASSYQEMWEKILGGETWRGEITNRHRDGSLYQEAMTITPIRLTGDRISHFVAVKEDLTTRKQADSELRESEERCRSLFQEARDLIFTTDSIGCITSANRAFEVLTGYTSEEVLDMCVFDLIATEQVDFAHQAFELVLSGGLQPYFELRMKTKGSTHLLLEVGCHPITRARVISGVGVIAREVQGPWRS